MKSVTIKMTVEEFEVYAAKHGRCELIHGEVKQMTPSGSNHGKITSRLNVLIGSHIMTHQLGDAFAAETGFRLVSDEGPVVRAPDFAFIATERATGETTSSFETTVPDLIIETVSPNDTQQDVSEKILWWLRSGVREAWVADPANKTITLHWPDGTSRRFGVDQSVDDSKVLPGLTVELSKVFTQ